MPRNTHEQIRGRDAVQGARRQLGDIAQDDSGAKESEVFNAVDVGRPGTLIPRKDVGRHAFLQRGVPVGGAGVGIVPPAVVGALDEVDGVAVREDAEDVVGGDGEDGVVCSCHRDGGVLRAERSRGPISFVSVKSGGGTRVTELQ
ncbi:MAG: hypothetical protein M1840_005208 [Geoglossum simile]|nr:MAG: hypothetical protein M1840_005208 [Geoglossum simile]